MKNKLLSIIIPAFNSSRELEACLQALYQQSDFIKEIIIVDDGSQPALSEPELPIVKLIRHKENLGPSQARNTGMLHAQSDFLLFIDSDIVIQPNTLALVKNHLDQTPSRLSAITCARHTIRLNQEDVGFITLYKEIYMNYIFSSQKNIVDFLYGGFCAFNRPENLMWPKDIRFGEDTYMGQLLFESGYEIKLLNQVELLHVKNYSLTSFLKHSFLVAFHFNQSLLTKKTIALHHSHATTHQLVSVIVTWLIVFNLLLGFFSLSGIFLGLWLIHNIPFISFLNQNLPSLKLLQAIFLTLLDQFTKGLGIFSGLFFFGLLHQFKKRKSTHSLIE